MSRFAKVNLLEVEDSVAGRVEGLEGRFSRKHLDSRDLGVSLFRYAPNLRSPMAHSHKEQEEAYVVVAGSGRILLDDETQLLQRTVREFAREEVAPVAGELDRTHSFPYEIVAKMAALGQLTSGVGHEVKNPINAIVVHLELLRNKMDAQDAPAIRHLNVIQSEIQRLDRVVQTLVDFSRPVELQLHDQDLRSIVNAVLMLASAELETRDVRVVNLMPDRPVISKVDSDLMKQALLNVVLNGAQAMATGGILRVRLIEDARWAILSISDEGEGIPDDIRSKIFNLYFTTKKDGSGIGLAMTYRIVQLHNGQLDVESQMGEGTTFTLRIPVTSPPETKLRGQMEAGAATGTIISKEPWG